MLLLVMGKNFRKFRTSTIGVSADLSFDITTSPLPNDSEQSG